MTCSEKYAWLETAAADLRRHADRARECWAAAKAAEEFSGSADLDKRDLGAWLTQAAATMAERLASDLEELAEVVGAPEGGEA